MSWLLPGQGAGQKVSNPMAFSRLMGQPFHPSSRSHRWVRWREGNISQWLRPPGGTGQPRWPFLAGLQFPVLLPESIFIWERLGLFQDRGDGWQGPVHGLQQANGSAIKPQPMLTQEGLGGGRETLVIDPAQAALPKSFSLLNNCC